MGEILLGVVLVLTYIVFVSLTIWLIVVSIKDREFILLFLSLILMPVALVPIAYGVDYYREQQAVQKIEIIQAEVQGKEYVPPRTTYVLSGKFIVPIRVSEQYNVHLKAGEHQEVIDNQQIYNAIEIGDKFEVEVVVYVKENGETLTKKIQFIGGE